MATGALALQDGERSAIATVVVVTYSTIRPGDADCPAVLAALPFHELMVGLQLQFQRVAIHTFELPFLLFLLALLRAYEFTSSSMLDKLFGWMQLERTLKRKGASKNEIEFWDSLHLEFLVTTPEWALVLVCLLIQSALVAKHVTTVSAPEKVYWFGIANHTFVVLEDIIIDDKINWVLREAIFLHHYIILEHIINS